MRAFCRVKQALHKKTKTVRFRFSRKESGSWKQKVERGYQVLGGGGNGEFSGYRVSVVQDRKVLEIYAQQHAVVNGTLYSQKWIRWLCCRCVLTTLRRKDMVTSAKRNRHLNSVLLILPIWVWAASSIIPFPSRDMSGYVFALRPSSWAMVLVFREDSFSNSGRK